MLPPRCVLTVLCVLGLASGAAGAPDTRAELPPDRPFVLSGRVARLRNAAGPVRLLIVQARYHADDRVEVLMDRPLEGERFKVSFPVPTGPAMALFVAEGRPAAMVVLPAETRSHRIRKIVELPAMHAARFRVRGPDGPVAGAEVRYAVMPAGIGYGAEFFLRRGRTDATGGLTIPVGPDDGLRLVVRSESLFGSWSGPASDVIDAPRGKLLDLARPAVRLALRDASTMKPVDPARVSVVARTAIGEVPVARRPGPGWQGELPDGTMWVRATVPGRRPVVFRDLEPVTVGGGALKHGAMLDPAGGMSGRLFLTERAQFRWDRREGGLFCGTGALHAMPGVRCEIRPVGAETWQPARWTRGGSHPVHLVLAAGTYEMRLQGELGGPRTKTIVIPAGTDVMDTISVAGGAGIRVVVRGEMRRAALERISFRLLDLAGQPVRADYETYGRLGEKARVREMSFTDVPNGGLLRVEPGEFVLDLLRATGDAVLIPIRTYPGAVTRLDTRFSLR